MKDPSFKIDSCAQIIDGTIGTMTVETTSTFFDSSTQTGEFKNYNKTNFISLCLTTILKII